MFEVLRCLAFLNAAPIDTFYVLVSFVAIDLLFAVTVQEKAGEMITSLSSENKNHETENNQHTVLGLHYFI